MCFEFDARPPELPDGRAVIAGGAAAESLTLTAADGNTFAAALAESPNRAAPASSSCPTSAASTASTSSWPSGSPRRATTRSRLTTSVALPGAEQRGEDFDWKPEVEKTSIEGIQTDIGAAREALAERTDATRFASVGFCFGGSHSFWAGPNPDLGLDAVVGFYGGLAPTNGRSRGRT